MAPIYIPPLLPAMTYGPGTGPGDTGAGSKGNPPVVPNPPGPAFGPLASGYVQAPSFVQQGVTPGPIEQLGGFINSLPQMGYGALNAGAQLGYDALNAGANQLLGPRYTLPNIPGVSGIGGPSYSLPWFNQYGNGQGRGPATGDISSGRGPAGVDGSGIGVGGGNPLLGVQGQAGANQAPGAGMTVGGGAPQIGVGGTAGVGGSANVPGIPGGSGGLSDEQARAQADWLRIKPFADKRGISADRLINVYMNPNRGPAAAQDFGSAYGKAVADDVWGNAATQAFGRPPNQQEWNEHFQAMNFGGRDPLEGHGQAIQQIQGQMQQIQQENQQTAYEIASGLIKANMV